MTDCIGMGSRELTPWYISAATRAWFFLLSHRLALAQAAMAAMAAGFRVHLVGDIENEAEIIEAQKVGIEFHRIELTRGEANQLHDLQSLEMLKRSVTWLTH